MLPFPRTQPGVDTQDVHPHTIVRSKMFRLAILCLALGPLLAFAQFGSFFQNAFHAHHGQQPHHQHKQQDKGDGSHRGWQVQDEGESKLY
jgi:hypothetical protein